MIDIWRNYTTRQWERWWKKRKIDWNKEYLATWNHPHRNVISSTLKQLPWAALLEVGCGAGANLLNIIKRINEPLLAEGKQGKMLGGIDINPDAIKAAEG